MEVFYINKIDKTLKQLFLKETKITENELKKFQENHNQLGYNNIEDYLLEKNIITEKKLIEIYSKRFNIDFVNLEEYALAPHLSQYVPEKIAREKLVIPLQINNNNKLEVAVNNPYNLEVIENIKSISQKKVKVYLTTKANIKHGISKIYFNNDNQQKELFDDLNSLREQINNVEKEEDLREIGNNAAPVIKLANVILIQAINNNASDIHIEPQKNKVKIRYRIDGILHEHMNIPKYIQESLISRIKIISNLNITENRKPQDGRVNVKLNDMSIDLRVSIIPSIYGEKIVIRLLNKNDSILELNQLGYYNYNLKRFKKMINRPYGIILVSGPTGSGKTTSLFGALQEFDSTTKNIITVENPVEYKLKNLTQIEIKNDSKHLSYKSVLQSILRQDPDIIMIGEIRNLETAQIAIRAALTGHLVLSTIHTNDAIGAIFRLIDMGIPPYLIASSLNGVISQRLARKICPYCKKEVSPRKQNDFKLTEKKDFPIYQGNGCPSCNNTGYKGRIPIVESLIINEDIQESIIKQESKKNVENIARKNGLLTLRENGLKKVEEKLTTYEEVLRTTFVL
jgi:type IV pilus assembly protein PilB